jgi:hypothetical protein
MRIVALIDEAPVIERILRHLGLWEAGVRVGAARDPPQPVEPVIEPGLDDPFPDYEIEAVQQARDGKLATRGAVSCALGARISRPPTGGTR